LALTVECMRGHDRLDLIADSRSSTVLTQSRSSLLEAFGSKADPQTGLNQSSYFLTEKSLDDAQELDGAVGLGDVVVAA
jgi:hypothetical protein